MRENTQNECNDQAKELTESTSIIALAYRRLLGVKEFLQRAAMLALQALY